MTGFEIVFGREIRMPLDQMVCYWKGKEEENESAVKEYVQTLRANMQVARDLAYEREVREKAKHKKYYDLRQRIEPLL